MNKLTKNSKITLVELPPMVDGNIDGEFQADVYTKFTRRLPSRALHYLSSYLVNDGWKDVEIISPLHDGDNGKLTRNQKERIFKSDVLGLSALTRTAPQSLELISQFKKVNPNGLAISGGPDPTFRTQEWLNRGTDIVFLGESDKTFPLAMNQLTNDPDGLAQIGRLAYNDGKGTIITDPKFIFQGFISYHHLSFVPKLVCSFISICFCCHSFLERIKYK